MDQEVLVVLLQQRVENHGISQTHLGEQLRLIRITYSLALAVGELD